MVLCPCRQSQGMKRSGPKSLAEIGIELGGVGAAALCRNRKVLEEELKSDGRLARMYEAIFRGVRL
jgi:hypothetical protein